MKSNSQYSIYNIQFKEWVCKPSSVFRVSPGGGHFSGPAVARRLSRKGCDLPAGFMTGPARGAPKGPPACSVLQAVGFALPSASPPARCALTAPFHPCLIPVTGAIGGVFSVALSRGSLRVAVNHHRALPCSDFPPAVSDRRPPDPLGPIIPHPPRITNESPPEIPPLKTNPVPDRRFDSCPQPLSRKRPDPRRRKSHQVLDHRLRLRRRR
jgi:hypothetical protein